MESVIITGGTGLVGSHLTKLLLDKGYNVSHLTRNPGMVHLSQVKQFYWDPSKNEIEHGALDHDYIVHLAGANISEGRWTEKRKQVLYESRVGAAKLLAEKITTNSYLPKAYISASAVGYYGAITSRHPFTEEDKPGSDFLAKLCVEWEKAASSLSEKNIRTVFIRTAFVLSPIGGGLDKLLKAAKYKLLSPLGSGNQYMPWVHISDLAHCYLYAIMNDKMKGAFNAAADDIRTNAEFTKALVQASNSKIILPNVPRFILKIALGEMESVLTAGSPVSNKKLQNYGFDFIYDNLNIALKDIYRSRQNITT